MPTHPSAETLRIQQDESKSLLLDRSSRERLNADLDGAGDDGANERDEDQLSDDSVERLVYGDDYVQRRRAEREQALKEAAEAAAVQQELDARLGGQLPIEALTPEQHTLMKAYMARQFKGEEAKNPISILSKVAGVKTKDYITYTPDQLHLHDLMHGQNLSQHRLQVMRQKRAYHQAQKPAARSVQPVAAGRRNIPLKHKQAPFSTKQFVEDMQRRGQVPVKRAADKLPRVEYKNEPRQAKVPLADSSLSFQPQTRQVHLMAQPPTKKYKVQSSGRSNLQERSTSTQPIDPAHDYSARRTNIFQVHPHHNAQAGKDMFEKTQSTSKLDAQQYQITYP